MGVTILPWSALHVELKERKIKLRPLGRSAFARRAAQPLLGEFGRICKSGCGEIDICPINGRSWAAIRRMEAATPVANSASETRPARGSSQWTKAIATRAHAAC